MPFYRELLRFELGFVSREVLPGLAVSALEEGLDSPALRILAAHSLCAYDPVGIEAAYAAAREDFGVLLPARPEALRLLLELLLGDIVNNAVDPYLGAKQVIGEIHSDWDEPVDVHFAGDGLGIQTLLGLTDYIDDLLASNRELQRPPCNADLILECKEKLRVEAARLVATRPWRGAPPQRPEGVNGQ